MSEDTVCACGIRAQNFEYWRPNINSWSPGRLTFSLVLTSKENDLTCKKVQFVQKNLTTQTGDSLITNWIAIFDSAPSLF